MGGTGASAGNALVSGRVGDGMRLAETWCRSRRVRTSKGTEPNERTRREERPLARGGVLARRTAAGTSGATADARRSFLSLGRALKSVERVGQTRARFAFRERKTDRATGLKKSPPGCQVSNVSWRDELARSFSPGKIVQSVLKKHPPVRRTHARAVVPRVARARRSRRGCYRPLGTLRSFPRVRPRRLARLETRRVASPRTNTLTAAMSVALGAVCSLATTPAGPHAAARPRAAARCVLASNERSSVAARAGASTRIATRLGVAAGTPPSRPTPRLLRIFPRTRAKAIRRDLSGSRPARVPRPRQATRRATRERPRRRRARFPNARALTVPPSRPVRSSPTRSLFLLAQSRERGDNVTSSRPRARASPRGRARTRTRRASPRTPRPPSTRTTWTR